MVRKIEGRGAIEIDVAEGLVSIAQEEGDEGLQTIYISPHDVPMLTKHLRDAAKEAKSLKAQ